MSLKQPKMRRETSQNGKETSSLSCVVSLEVHVRNIGRLEHNEGKELSLWNTHRRVTQHVHCLGVPECCRLRSVLILISARRCGRLGPVGVCSV
jgi:hypothetical protein